MTRTLLTERMVLRPVEARDVDLLVLLDADPEVMRYLTGRPSTRAEVEAAIVAALGHRWVAFARADDRFVGWFACGAVDDVGTFEIGYRIRRRCWGTGLATEGARAMIDHAFGAGDAARVTAQTMAVNERSRRVMERCGMRHARTFHLTFDDPLPGTEHGEVEYELDREEWRRTGPVST